MYENGQGGLPKNDAQAVSWYHKAADAGDPAGMTRLGFMYENGRGGLPQDGAQAVSWYRKAKDLGDTSALDSLTRLTKEQAIKPENTAPKDSNPCSSDEMPILVQLHPLGDMIPDDHGGYSLVPCFHLVTRCLSK